MNFFLNRYVKLASWGSSAMSIRVYGYSIAIITRWHLYHTDLMRKLWKVILGCRKFLLFQKLTGLLFMSSSCTHFWCFRVLPDLISTRDGRIDGELKVSLEDPCWSRSRKRDHFLAPLVLTNLSLQGEFLERYLCGCRGKKSLSALLGNRLAASDFSYLQRESRFL